MKSKHLFLLLLAALLALPVIHARGQAQVTFDILLTFDYPGGLGTSPWGLNDAGDIVGGYTNNEFFSNGFIRFHNGNFSAPIIEPNDNMHSTVLEGINNLGNSCGTYGKGNPDSHFHGFLLSGVGTFTDFDIEGVTDTTIHGINDAGNFCGSFEDGVHPSAGWVSLDGSIEAFSIANDTFANGINNLNQVVGSYVGAQRHSHSFVRDADGTFHYPINARGGNSTILFGINDKGQMVGFTNDDVGALHAVFFSSLRESTTFDYPGAVDTGFIGINGGGLISGFYTDAFGFSHAFIVRVRPAPGE
jgi:hypothetical protein